MKQQQYASDNYAGICPEAWLMMQQANQGSEVSYGKDEWTRLASDQFRSLFEHDCEVFFVFTGTAANALAVSSMCQPYHSLICSEMSHMETDECGAPEFFSHGSKLLVAPSRDGKLRPEEVRRIALSRTDIHFPKPHLVSISQPTETGLVYTPEEIQAISQTCRDLGLKLYMDGARFANACHWLQCDPADITWKAGVDVMCFGGSKGGMGMGEAILFFNKEMAQGFDFRCKQAGQLASKMRYLAAPWIGMLKSGAWLNNARHSHECAKRLADRVRELPSVEVMFDVQSNGVFIQAPEELLAGLRERGWLFYTFIGGGARFMFAWDADPACIDWLIEDMTELAAAYSS